jgi:hypothetical protein
MKCMRTAKERESSLFTFLRSYPTGLVMSSSSLLSTFQPVLLPHLFYTLSSLALLIILSLAYSRLSGLFGSDKNMSITVKWGRERLVSSLSPNTALPRVYHASPSPLLLHRTYLIPLSASLLPP